MRLLASSSAIGATILDARKQRSWTQAQLAEHANVSTPTLSKLERGNRHSEIGTVLRVVSALGLQLGLVETPQDADADSLGDLLDDLGSNR